MATGWQYGPQVADAFDLTEYLRVDGTRPGTAFQELLGLNFTDSVELTISSGAVTRTQTFHNIDTEADAATDDLDTINGGNWGDWMVIHPNVDGRTIVIKHMMGNILCVGNTDITLDDAHDVAILIHGNVNWSAFTGFRVSEATQTEQQTGTAQNLHASPANQQWHDSAASAWVKASVSGGTPIIDAHSNISSITDNGVGTFTVNINNDMATTDYSVVLSAGLSGSRVRADLASNGSIGTGSFAVIISNTSGTLVDPDVFTATVHGDLA